ncbi:uncharacterized protein LOC9658975 [Selaginella moellendorffii]|uniref:uncharacterized protein LOC9658975 n=1 Tax=Selaginella moellendorffii TaxID=88036 RepID=UPI000D1C806C|nr:uncharacterized protein LOC9658975 [Selaginella moellendorffii]|eukprot:XP_024539427.1 uncharacterized protein LOC9658975 [Selaginella moellendorffii]
MEEEASRHSVALVLDFGSQYTHLITRRIRQLGVCSFCLSAAEASLDAIAKLAPSLILLSGGPHSVYEPGAPSVPPGFFDYVRDRGVPVVGICYGLQLIVAQMGGSVEPAANREYGSMDVVPVAGSVLYGDDDSTQSVWMSHGDEVVEMPRGFVVVARSVQGSIAAIENPDLGIYALQYHPEKPKYLVQGTLYPDVIESCPPPGVVGHSHTIKSHHNVGGLPPSMKLLLLEPLKWLFKDEVRKLGKLLGIPEGFLKRHPFPGPGLAVRVIGGDVTEENLETLRLVDEVFTASIKEAGLYDEMWQAFAGILPVKTVGVQGDKRTHSGSVVLRAVTSEDGMTAERYSFKREFLDQVTREICNTVVDVNRVFYDLTSKPPATIEWE